MKKRTAAAYGLVLTLVVICTAATGIGMWVFYSEVGLHWLTARLSRSAGEDLTLEGVAGTLASGARVRHIRYASEDIEVQVREAELVVEPLSVLRLRPRVSGLTAAEVVVTTKPGETRDKPPDTLALPLDFEVADVYVKHLQVNLGEQLVDITNVRLNYSGGTSEHRVDLDFAVMGLSLSLRGTIAAHSPFALSAAFAAEKPQDPQASVAGEVDGNLTVLTVSARAQSGDARINARAGVHPYSKQPLSELIAQVSALDLQNWMPDLPHTKLAADVKFERAGELQTGTVELTNAIPGPYDSNRIPLVHLRAALETDWQRLDVAGLIVDLGPAGAISGSGRLSAGAMELALKTHNVNLAALHSKMRRTQLAGSVKITLADGQQRVIGDLREGDLSLSLIAARAGDAISIQKFEARARGGVASGEAQLSMAQPQPFLLNAKFGRFDPAAWGDFPHGAINGDLLARGTISGPTADVRFALRGSRWLGAPLDGHGTFSVSTERVRNAGVQLTLGGNQFVLQGALGDPADKLSVRFDAPRLALIATELSGRLRGNAQVSGDFKSPQVKFDLIGAGLRHERYGAVKALSAHGVIGMQVNAPLDVTLRANGISAPQGQLAAASLRINGTRSAHTAMVEAQGPRIDFHARAQGGLQEGNRWTGTVHELANRGEVPIALEAPVPVSVGSDHVRIQPLRLRAIGGELVVTELAYENGRLATTGRFSDFPVKPIVTLAGGPAEFAGTLRLAGRWSIRSAPQLLGSVTIARESGDVTLGPKSPLLVGLQTLAFDAQFAERGVQFTARLSSALATASATGTVGALSGVGVMSYGATSSLEFSAEAQIARLQPFTAFIDAPLLIRGEAAARLRGSGTVGDPQINGTVSADKLALAMPVEGIELTEGTLRAVVTDREVRVESFSIRGGDGILKATGTLARAGFDQAAVEWQAERFRLLARPDRRLVVSGKGRAALKEGRVSLTGKVRADEGAFDIGETRLPTLGDDVVILGRKPQRPEREAPARLPGGVALDLTVALGNQVLVQGQGLQVWLSGDIRIYTNARGEILASGTINARNGTFVAYGARLEIDRGYFYFNGAISNPALDIVALRKRQAVEAGVAVGGTLNNPIVRVVSNPPVPESEALSWLILGHGPDRATAQELSALPLAASALLGKASGSLAKAIGVDEIGIRGAGLEGQVVTVGKRINDRIYAYFEQSLGAAESALRLEMTLTRRIVLSLRAGEPSSVGVFYRYRWD